MKYHFHCMRCFHLGCIFCSYLWLWVADIFDKVNFTCKRNSVLYFVQNVINVLNLFWPALLLRGNPGFLPTSKMEFFARIVSNWKPLSINICLQWAHIWCKGFFHGILQRKIKILFFSLLLFTYLNLSICLELNL